jgi:hypothetical protein
MVPPQTAKVTLELIQAPAVVLEAIPAGIRNEDDSIHVVEEKEPGSVKA